MNEEKKFLESLARKNGGILKVDDVIEAAKDESCVLHSHFEWDDTEAAKSFRKEQARTLIQRCRITLADRPTTYIRLFTSLPSDRENGGGYRLTSTVLNDEQMKLELIHDIELTIARWRLKLHLLDDELGELLLAMEENIKACKEESIQEQMVA
jgi:hypothetical protein